MVITGIAIFALIVFITVGVLARKHLKKKEQIEAYESQISKLRHFRNELVSHHTLEDIFKIHKQLGQSNLALNRAICPDEYGMFRTSDIATMSMDEVFLGNIYGLWTHTLTYWVSSKNEDSISIVTNQYYTQVLSGIDIEIEELNNKIHSL